LTVYLDQALAMVQSDAVDRREFHPCQPTRFSVEDRRPESRRTHPTQTSMLQLNYTRKSSHFCKKY